MSSLVSCGPDLPGKRPQTADHFARAHAVLRDRQKRIPRFVKIGIIPVQELQGGLAMGHDGGERLIDLVGDRRGEVAHRRQANSCGRVQPPIGATSHAPSRRAYAR